MATNNPDLGMTPNRRNRRGLASTPAADPVREDVQQEEERQLNVSVPLGLHRQIRILAVQEDISIKEWCIRALWASIDK